MPKIRSSSDPNDPRPWFKFDINPPLNRVVFSEANGRPGLGRVVTTHAIKIDPALPNEVHVLAVTEDGIVDFVPLSKQRPVYYAHLAWYDPSTGTLTTLDFEDGA